MKIDPAAAGRPLGAVETTLTARRALAFAAGLGLDDARYLDDARPGGPELMPAACVAIEWPLADGIAFCEALGIRPADYYRVAVHGEQDSRFLRLPAVGERLTTSARLETLRGTGAGVMMGCRFDTADEAGAPVFESHSVVVLRGATLDGGPAGSSTRGGDEPPDPDPAAARVDTIPVARGLPHVYSECAGIWNPIHTERAVARASDLPDIILHGTATWALAMDRIVRAHAGGDPHRLRRLSCRFSGMVIPGEPVTLRHQAAGGRVAFDALDPRGASVLARGIAEIAPA